MFPVIIENIAEGITTWVASSAGWDITKTIWQSFYRYKRKELPVLVSFEAYTEAHDLLQKMLSLYGILGKHIDDIVEDTFRLVAEPVESNLHYPSKYDMLKRQVSDNNIKEYSRKLRTAFEKAESCLRDITNVYEQIEQRFPSVLTLIAHNLAAKEEVDSVLRYKSHTLAKSNKELIAELSEKNDRRLQAGDIHPAGCNPNCLPRGMRGAFRLMDKELRDFLISSFASGKWHINARYISLLDIDRLIWVLIQARNDPDARWAYCLRLFLELRKIDYLTVVMTCAIKWSTSALLEMRETGKFPDDIGLKVATFEASDQLSKLINLLRRMKKRGLIDSEASLNEVMELKQKSRSYLKEASKPSLTIKDRLSFAKKSKSVAMKAFKELQRLQS